MCQVMRPPNFKSAARIARRSTPGASLVDLGDGVLAIEFHSKMNAIGGDTLAAVLTHLVEPGAISLGRAIEAMSTVPARLLGAYLVPSGNVMPFASVMLPEEVIQRRLQENSDLQHDAEARFRGAAAQAGLA